LIPLACALHGFAASPIAFISHERKQGVIQLLHDVILILLKFSLNDV